MQEGTTLSPITAPHHVTGMTRQESRDAGQAEQQSAAAIPKAAQEMTAAEVRELEKLQRRDREVKAHEQAHKVNAGRYANGAASFDYKIGPDGKRYAVGGEVSIDISREADPQRTLEKAEVIRRAALAPADPSAQDRRIAAQATMMAAEARQELLATKPQPTRPSTSSPPEEQFTTATGRRALGVIHAVQSASLKVREDPFDHFI
ncbi:MAG: putative metalloprotease CJM1_0395 family protein [Gammaproteobacteria bacterium]|nr:putative metalloprotease CJM1_0395 family protein [Gammaproteobacteria bacterium]